MREKESGGIMGMHCLDVIVILVVICVVLLLIIAVVFKK
jgi:hypothetical protein